MGVLRDPGDEEHMPLDLGVLIRVLDEHSKEMKEVTAGNVTPRVCFFRPRRWVRPANVYEPRKGSALQCLWAQEKGPPSKVFGLREGSVFMDP